ncbi:hypothetical protein K493DRAFT_363415 [Basidiobolus meristosporus CBS 931.73]|nr:hypothetical protein K493DRAFT_363415 [Basidiobolus meristosporus CBS 931.73]|eukprot:ORX77217.1 hypothetical protein K493DRAFT_363415 [Basidiobolus meristosporus CBS 931.73]
MESFIGSQLLTEFTGITNNEAYKRAFNDRVFQRDERTGHVIGNDQRELFTPYLLDFVSGKKVIVDLGAGAGELLDDIHPYVLESTFYIEEPNRMLLNEYIERLRRYDIQLREASSSPAQEYLKRKDKQNFADCVLSIHMIYHLTDLTAEDVNPEADLKDFIVQLYDLLADGGGIFLVYADMEKAFAGKVAASYFATHGQKHHHSNLLRLYRTRNEVLQERGILPVLQSLYPRDKITMSSVVCNSRFYGDSVDDLAAMSLVGELIESNDEPFDVRKLQHALNMLHNPQSDIKLGKRAGMWSANEEQVVCIINKN